MQRKKSSAFILKEEKKGFDSAHRGTVCVRGVHNDPAGAHEVWVCVTFRRDPGSVAIVLSRSPIGRAVV